MAVVCALSLMGCTSYRLTTGYTRSEFTRYEGIHISMKRALLLLSENKYAYEDMFNNRIWDEEVDGVAMGDYTKDLVKDTVEHMIFLRRMADDMEIALTDDENEQLDRAAAEYMASYETEPEYFTIDTVRAYYEDLLLAEKVFYAVTDKVDTEVSTDEARIIDVQYLFFANSERDESGKVVALSANAYAQKYELACEILEKLKAGEDLISFVTEYSDDTSYYLELGRGEYNTDFEEAAFALEMGEVSEVVETEVGYYIIKCTNDNVSDDYERRKESIVMERRLAMFEDAYAAYTTDATIYYNDLFWEEYDIHDLAKGSGRLQEIFASHFGES